MGAQIRQHVRRREPRESDRILSYPTNTICRSLSDTVYTPDTHSLGDMFLHLCELRY